MNEIRWQNRPNAVMMNENYYFDFSNSKKKKSMKTHHWMCCYIRMKKKKTEAVTIFPCDNFISSENKKISKEKQRKKKLPKQFLFCPSAFPFLVFLSKLILVSLQYVFSFAFFPFGHLFHSRALLGLNSVWSTLSADIKNEYWRLPKASSRKTLNSLKERNVHLVSK